jgi:hypothetical protein
LAGHRDDRMLSWCVVELCGVYYFILPGHCGFSLVALGSIELDVQEECIEIALRRLFSRLNCHFYTR